MAVYCDGCLALPQRFGCGWCRSSAADVESFCLRSDRCLQTSGTWLQHPFASCNNPRILQILPENATLSSQAPLEIRGVNLGDQPERVKIQALFEGGSLEPVPCIVLPEGFQPSRQVVCRLLPASRIPPLDTPLPCRIVMRLEGADNQASMGQPAGASRRCPHSPLRGPVAGGTLLRIRGKNLNVGASVAVILRVDTGSLQKGAICEIRHIFPDLITCQTQSVSSILPHFASDPEGGGTQFGLRSFIDLLNDKTLTRAPLQTFTYTPNPTIRAVSKSLIFLGGGTTLRIYGQYLDVIEDPQIVFYYNSMEYIEPCKSTIGHLSCVSPSLEVPRGGNLVVSDGPPTTLVRSITNPSILPKIYSSENGEEYGNGASGGSIDVSYGFIMDNVTELLVFGTLTVFPNPEFFPFADGRLVEPFTPPASPHPPSGKPVRGNLTFDHILEESAHSQDHHLLRFRGKFRELAEVSDLQALEELSIVVATATTTKQANTTCKLTVIKPDEIQCEISKKELVEGEDCPVVIRIGRYLTSRPGTVQFKRLGALGGRDRIVVVASSLMGIVTLVACLFLAMWCRSKRTERDLQQRFKIRWAEQEKCVTRAFKSDFMELQTHVDELVHDLNKSSLPVRDYQTYCLFSLFPDYHLNLVRPTDPHDMPPAKANHATWECADAAGEEHCRHPLVSTFKVQANVQEAADRGLFLFNRILCNRHFLCLLVRAIESNRNIDARAKSQIASLLSIILQPNMEYFTQIIMLLIADQLRKSRDHGGDSRLLTAFRRAESVVAKLLSNWLTFLLYNFINEHAAEHLFILYRALLQQINTGPKDAVTGHARYTLDAGTLLKSDYVARTLTLLVVDSEGLFGPFSPTQLPVRLLSCDTITQAKEKILDAIYRNTPYKNQIRPTDVHLNHFERANEFLMMDWDLDIRRDASNGFLEGPPYRLNCLSDYKMNENDVVALVRADGPVACGGTSASHRNDGGDIHTTTSPSNAAWDLRSPKDARIPNGHHRHPHPHIRPTGVPSPLYWYHLERPNAADLQRFALVEVSNKPGRQVPCPSARRSFVRCRGHRSFSLCIPSKGAASGPQQEEEQQQPCLDAASLRHWLATDTARAPQPRAHPQRPRKVPSKVLRAGSPTFETADLASSFLHDGDDSDAMDRPMAKLPCEIFLNRLLRTRVSVVNYMENVVELIFGVVRDSQSPPLCIKFLFDFLDSQADALEIRDPNILHAWKANCLYLRFWNQILINLDYIFDIPLLRNTALERSFHSFSQALTYACSPVLDKVTMDSPINKALFSSDIELINELTVAAATSPASSHSTMEVGGEEEGEEEATEGSKEYSVSRNANSFRASDPRFQAGDWEPLRLLQALKEVNSCMLTVAQSNTSASSTSTPLFPPTSSHSATQSHNQSSEGGGEDPSNLRPGIPRAEWKLPPLPTPPFR
ncbi:unnamed protein product [Mesocestoides corti]|uniref:IPT/TIG domain-containing protein n=1 Tax=Mesocestoides corti TaxID=53468 RepID=A0A0R3UKX1_MESCO|nr:unnamed protein product [Mesocestoides corti]